MADGVDQVGLEDAEIRLPLGFKGAPPTRASIASILPGRRRNGKASVSAIGTNTNLEQDGGRYPRGLTFESNSSTGVVKLSEAETVAIRPQTGSADNRQPHRASSLKRVWESVLLRFEPRWGPNLRRMRLRLGKPHSGVVFQHPAYGRRLRAAWLVSGESAPAY
ncbi:hypothetical protein U0070_023029 [Myodes glareolus]|uniref:Uncharacterized protein n=1 Tax=Myodes glareolus TaxID=447135 RepID=A0AAW0HRT3_MYOGA